MQVVRFLTCLCLLLPVLGTVDIRLPQSIGDAVSPLGNSALHSELTRCNEDALTLARGQQYLQAEAAYERCYQHAVALGSLHKATRSLAGVATARFLTFRYREAMRAYLEARTMADRSGDREMAAILSGNISALFATMGAAREASQAVDEGLAVVPADCESSVRGNLLLQRAVLYIQADRIEEAQSLFGRALMEWDRQGDMAAQAFGWERIGAELIQRGRLDPAEAALSEGLRLRKALRDPAPYYSYRNLAMLRLAQGNPAGSLSWMDKAMQVPWRKTMGMPPWNLHYHRARALASLGKRYEAHRELQTALRYARQWRLAALPADSVRAAAGVVLHELYSAFVELGGELYFENRQRALARSAFEASEENKAASLREAINAGGDRQNRLPREYWEALSQLQSAEAALFRDSSGAALGLVEHLNVKLTEIEVRAGLAAFGQWRGGAPETRAAFLPHLQRNILRPDETLLSFHLGDASSYLWAVTKHGFELYRLPARRGLEAAAKRFLEAVKSDSPEAIALGEKLYLDLFGGLKPAHRRNPRWLLALEGALFEVPLAALVAGRSGNGDPVFLVEQHSLRVVPSALALASPDEERWDGPLVAVGDPIYNRADPRWEAGGRLSPLLEWGIAKGSPAGVELPRLGGSARELEACARALDGDQESILLAGWDARWERVAQALEARPSVMHFAAHVIASPRNPRQSLLALGLGPDGREDVLNAAAIATLDVRPRLLVMSGCSSGRGEIVPGEGLMGLTRAWLSAGAESVGAALWPTIDDSGELWQSFYRHYRESRGKDRIGRPDQALQRAQVDMLQSMTWRARPSYWAAYFIVGRR